MSPSPVPYSLWYPMGDIFTEPLPGDRIIDHSHGNDGRIDTPGETQYATAASFSEQY